MYVRGVRAMSYHFRINRCHWLGFACGVRRCTFHCFSCSGACYPANQLITRPWISVCRTGVLNDPCAFCWYELASGFGLRNYRRLSGLLLVARYETITNKIVQVRFVCFYNNFRHPIACWTSSYRSTIRRKVAPENRVCRKRTRSLSPVAVALNRHSLFIMMLKLYHGKARLNAHCVGSWWNVIFIYSFCH